MNDNVQSRLRAVAKECGGNRAICEKSGISERTFANWIGGLSEPKIAGIAAIAEVAGVTIDWLVHGHKPKYRLSSRENGDNVTVPCLDHRLNDDEVDVEQGLVVCGYYPFAASFLEQELKVRWPDKLCLLVMKGDAMVPTLNEADQVLIDRSTGFESDGLYAVVLNDVIHVKRLASTKSGLELTSDNAPLYAPMHFSDMEIKKLPIVGRVLWVGKSLI